MSVIVTCWLINGIGCGRGVFHSSLTCGLTLTRPSTPTNVNEATISVRLTIPTHAGAANHSTCTVNISAIRPKPKNNGTVANGTSAPLDGFGLVDLMHEEGINVRHADPLPRTTAIVVKLRIAVLQ